MTVSLSKIAIRAYYSSTTVVETATTDVARPGSAEAEAQRAKQALGTIVQAKKQVAVTMKAFLREKLEGAKKQLQILRLLGGDPLDIAKGAVKIARGVASAARDYAAATRDENSAAAPVAATGGEPRLQAEDEAAALKNKADAAPLDSGTNSQPDAPAGADEGFFYDAFRILGLARKTVAEAQSFDTQTHGPVHANDFKKLHKRQDDFESAVGKAYIAMKTDGDLKSVDALLTGGPDGPPAISTLV